jgi:hypothetical protein
MNFKRLTSIALAILLALLCAGAFADEADTAAYEARIAELEARIAELEQELSLRDYVAVFDGGAITAAEAMERYEYIAYMYESYGYSIAGYEDEVKQDIVTALVQEAVVHKMAAELGVGVPDAQREEELRAEAQASYDEYIVYFRGDFAAEGKSDADIDAETQAYLAESGLTLEVLYQDLAETYAREQLYAHVAGDVAATDEEVQAEFDALVEADRAAYEAGGYAYESAVSGGTTVYWHPEGYRAVKHVLIAFDDAQRAEYTDLTARIADLTAELADEDAEDARDADEIQAELTAAQTQFDALYASLAPTADEVVKLFEEGTAIDVLIAQYGGDPGMASEPAASEGYSVAANSVIWDSAFTEAAMSIGAIGEISEPARAANGIHVVYYLRDVAPGAVDFEGVREHVSGLLNDRMQAEAYDAQLAAWAAEMNVAYHMENFR